MHEKEKQVKAKGLVHTNASFFGDSDPNHWVLRKISLLSIKGKRVANKSATAEPLHQEMGSFASFHNDPQQFYHGHFAPLCSGFYSLGSRIQMTLGVERKNAGQSTILKVAPTCSNMLLNCIENRSHHCMHCTYPQQWVGTLKLHVSMKCIDF